MDAEAGKPKKPSCPKCGNRLRVLADQIGTTVRCPKCNATFVIGRPGDEAKPAATPPEAEGEDDAYEPIIPLVRHSIAPEEPVETLVPDEARDVVYDTDWSTADEIEAEPPAVRPLVEDQKFEDAARARGLIRDERVLPPPRWTFFSGVFGYPWRGVNLARWTAMAFGLGVAGMMMHAALEWLGFIGGSANPIFGIFMAVFAVLVTLASLSFATASCQVAIQDTADGHDAPQEAPLDGWVLNLLAWAFLMGAAMVIGYPAALAVGPVAFLAAGVLVFPILLLSALECDSYLLPFSLPVLRTLGRNLFTWLTYYLLTTLMLAAWIVAFDYSYPAAPYATIFFSGMVLATIMLIWARLLGRLAWRISGMPGMVVEKSPDVKASALAPSVAAVESVKRKKRSRIRIEIPDEINSPDEPTPPPRINFHLRP
jgi:predicted Zn finger-like uncharacterized protein